MNLRMSLTDGRGGSHSVDEAVGAQGGWRLTECTAPGEAKPRGRPCGPCTRLSDAAPSFLEVSAKALELQPIISILNSSHVWM